MNKEQSSERVVPRPADNSAGGVITPEVMVSDDKLSASVKIPPGYQGTVDDILNLLQDKKIVFGIDHDAVKTGSEAAKSRQSGYVFVAASGTLPVDAVDGSVELKFNPGGMSAAVSAAGNIDYRESGNIVPVVNDQTLAVIKPPCDGTPGVDVFGKKIVPAQRVGRPQRIKTGRNVKLVGDAVIATSDGCVTFEQNTISVSERLVVPGDVDFSVGNIHFHGVVTIKGSVHPGFIVDADDDIDIQDNVTDATIKSAHNIVIQHGVDGEGRSFIKSGGNVNIGFVENGRIEAENDIEIASHVINSKLHAGGSIRVLKGKGVVLGGELRAGSGIEVKVAGRESTKCTMLAVGGGLEADRKIVETEHKTEELKHVLQHLKNQMGEKKFFAMRDDTRSMDELPDDAYKKLLALYRDKESGITALVEDKLRMQEEINIQKKGSIKIHERIAGPCMMEIGGLHLSVPDPKPGPLTYSADSEEGVIRESGG